MTTRPSQTAEVVNTGLSLDEIRRLVARALDEKLAPDVNPADAERMPVDYPWIQDLFDEVVIYHQKGTLWSASYIIDRTDDEAKAILGDPVEVRVAYVRAAEVAGYPTQPFLNKLRDLVRAKVKDGELSEADFQEAVRKARAHAGGLAKAEKIRGQKAKPEQADVDEEDGDDADEGPASGRGKKKETLPAAAGDVADICATGGSSRLFLEVRSFVDAPDWLPVLPKPGTYKHPVYGEIKITRGRNERFVDNFNSGVYQERIPIDGEHLTKESGALGWITQLRLNEDGSADARAEWNDRGRTMLSEDRFAYVSPEWFDKWTDPVDGTVHKDVLIGAALVTRPFFKEKALRSIAQAVEGALLMAEPGSADLTPLSPEQEGEDTMGDKNEQAQVQMSEEVARKFAELETQLKDTQSKLASETEARQRAETDAKAAGERITAMETAARRKRFEDVVLGRVEGGRRFFGEAPKHVDFLMKLAEAFGEDSEEVKHYIAEKQAQAEQLAESALLQTKGSSAPAGTSALGKIQARAKALREADPNLTEAQAIDRAARENPSLYTEHLRESGAGTGE